MKSRLSVTFSAAIIFIVLTTTANAATITITDFGSLPSTQGWTYSPSGASHGGQLEADVFSVDGVMLSMDTIGSPLLSPSGVSYDQPGVVNSDPFALSWTSRVLAHEGGGQCGFFVDVLLVGSGSLACFQTGQILLSSGVTLAHDNTVFHDYRIEATPGSGSYDFYIDNVLAAVPATHASTINALRFGDGAGSENARADLSAYSFVQSPASVPVPPAIFLFGSGLIGLAGMARRKKA